MTTKIYATRDYEGPCGRGILENATINEFATVEAAREWLLAPYVGGGWDMTTAKVEPSTKWSDCWIKSMSAPTAETTWIAPFTFDDLFIQWPGEHPGGRFWWITPNSEHLILVVSEIREIEEG